MAVDAGVRARAYPYGEPDTWLIGIAAVLVALGLIMVFSASSATAYALHHDALYFLKRQALWLAVGLPAAALAYRCDYRVLRRMAPLALALTLLALTAVLIPHVGLRANGAQRWLGYGGFSLQPSEFAKLGVIVYLATALARKGERVRDLVGGLVPPALVVGACVMLVFKEPDIGTATVIAFIAATMFFCAGARIMHLLSITAVTVPFILYEIVHRGGYERQRLLAFLDPWKYQQSSGFHVVQSLLALGSGGVIGRGLGFSVAKYFYLPEAHTDFIGSIIGEELGFLGTTLIVVLFVVLAYRAIRIAIGAPDRFGFFLSAGCASAIVVQAFLNLGVITSSWPVTGVPLPFVSYGGSSLVVSLVCVGLLANVGRRSRQS